MSPPQSGQRRKCSASVAVGLSTRRPTISPRRRGRRPRGRELFTRNLRGCIGNLFDCPPGRGDTSPSVAADEMESPVPSSGLSCRYQRDRGGGARRHRPSTPPGWRACPPQSSRTRAKHIHVGDDRDIITIKGDGRGTSKAYSLDRLEREVRGYRAQGLFVGRFRHDTGRNLRHSPSRRAIGGRAHRIRGVLER
jgi:hypothetical protein